MTKTLLITGASSGIGAETARHAVRAGWSVALAARSADKLEALVAELGAEATCAIPCDVTDEGAQQALFARAREEFGGLHAVFANAGIGASGMGTEGGEVDNWRDMVLTNVLGVAITARLAIPALKRTGGHLLVTGSRAGRVSLSGSIYGATKWAVRGYVRNLRQELAGSGVRVTEIAPGMVDTPFFDEPKPDALRPEDIATAVMHALSQPAHVDTAVIEVYPVRRD